MHQIQQKYLYIMLYLTVIPVWSYLNLKERYAELYSIGKG